MWSFLASLFSGGLSGIISGIGTGIVGPIANVLVKKQDVTLEGFKTATGYDLDAFKAAADHELAMNQLKITANNWWAPKLLYVIVGFFAAMHTAAIDIDSTFTFGTGHYGNLGVPVLPGNYAIYEQWVIASLFIVSTVQMPLNAVSAWLGRK